MDYFQCLNGAYGLFEHVAHHGRQFFQRVALKQVAAKGSITCARGIAFCGFKIHRCFHTLFFFGENCSMKLCWSRSVLVVSAAKVGMEFDVFCRVLKFFVKFFGSCC